MKILLAVDGSTFGDAAVSEVARRPWPAGSEVRIISAAEASHIPAPVPHGAADLYAEALEDACEQARTALARAASKLSAEGGTGLRITTAAPVGPAKEVILSEAEEWGADLIVVGSHGRGFWKRLFLGSVSQAVAAHAPCSVEIVRGPKAAEADSTNGAEGSAVSAAAEAARE
ncbi:MAG TPA: universal stress protein [Pyrinomonadaceae bacterium]